MSHKIYNYTLHQDYLADFTFFNGEIKQCNLKLLIESIRPASSDSLLALLTRLSIESSKGGLQFPNGERIDMDELWNNSYVIGFETEKSSAVSLANSIIDIREHLGMSQRELEKKSGVRQSEISKIERGEGNPSLKTIEKIMTAINHEINYVPKNSKRKSVSDCLPTNESVAKYINKCQGNYTISDIEQLPENISIELIEGIIYDMSVPTLKHQMIVNYITHSFNEFIHAKNGTCIALSGPTGVWFENDDTDLLIPDMLVVCDRSKLKAKGIVGAPDFVLEVMSPSTRHRDLVEKFKIYAEKGVREYWIIDPTNRKLIVHHFEKTDIPEIYGFNNNACVGIYNGELNIDLVEIDKILDMPD